MLHREFDAQETVRKAMKDAEEWAGRKEATVKEVIIATVRLQIGNHFLQIG